MASMKIVQFSRPPTSLVQLRPKFFHLLDFGRPISKEFPSPNHKQSINRQHNLRVNIICYQIFPLGWFSFPVSTH